MLDGGLTSGLRRFVPTRSQAGGCTVYYIVYLRSRWEKNDSQEQVVLEVECFIKKVTPGTYQYYWDLMINFYFDKNVQASGDMHEIEISVVSTCMYQQEIFQGEFSFSVHNTEHIRLKSSLLQVLSRYLSEQDRWYFRSFR